MVKEADLLQMDKMRKVAQPFHLVKIIKDDRMHGKWVQVFKMSRLAKMVYLDKMHK